mmetsp:Transcript_34561/g.86825  ORF Transcript_34561/g.86825 Transcript_34561/m.86825 type:complete len:581 (-) Transcript_34561:26-1768(-)
MSSDGVVDRPEVAATSSESALKRASDTVEPSASNTVPVDHYESLEIEQAGLALSSADEGPPAAVPASASTKSSGGEARTTAASSESTKEYVSRSEKMTKAAVLVNMLTGRRKTQPKRYLMRIRAQRHVVDFCIPLPGSGGWQVQSVVQASDILAAYAEEEDEKYIVMHMFQLNANKKRSHSAMSIRCKSRVERDEFLAALQAICRSTDGSGVDPTRTLLVAINPFGGKKKGEHIFRKYVEPVFKLRKDLRYDVLVTTHQGHAKEVAASLDPNKYYGVVTVSGDGLLNEVINGLMERPDSAEVTSRISVGIIAGGSGNGLATSLHILDPTTAAYTLAKGWRRPMDLFKVNFPRTQMTYYGFLLVEWAIISDIDFDSEKFRWMGGPRFTVAAIGLVMEKRLYRGRLSMLPAPDNTASVADASVAAPEGELSALPALDPNHPASAFPLRLREAYQRGEFTVIEADFTAFAACNVKAASYDAVLAPRANLNDGLIDLVFTHDVDRTDLAAFLLDMEKGNHLKHRFIQYHKVQAFTLEPSDLMRGAIGVDGEHAPLDAFACWMLPQQIYLLGGDLDLRHEPAEQA